MLLSYYVAQTCQQHVAIPVVRLSGNVVAKEIKIKSIVYRRHSLQDPLLIRKFPGVRLGAAVHRLQHFFPPGHSVPGVGLHVQHRGKLQSIKTKH